MALVTPVVPRGQLATTFSFHLLVEKDRLLAMTTISLMLARALHKNHE